VKERIRTETTAELTEKAEAERKKLSDQLAAGKVRRAECDDKVAQLDTVWTNRIRNEIAKRIERAHEYSFNLANYRSTLSESQLQEWAKAVEGIDQPNGLSIDARYARLVAADLKTAETLIAHLDPHNALELDIAKQYVTQIPAGQLGKYPRLKTLAKIIESGAKYPRVKLAQLLVPKYEKIKKDEYDGGVEIVEKIAFGDGKVHFREQRKTGMDLYLAEAGDLITSKINIHQGAVALAPRRLVASTHYQVYAFNSADVVPEYLVHVMRTPEFITQLADLKNKGIKNEQGADFLLEFQIPLPPVDAQSQIVAEAQRENEIAVGAQSILRNWKVDLAGVQNRFPRVLLGSLVADSLYGTSLKAEYQDEGHPVLRIGNIAFCDFDLSDIKRVQLTEREFRKYELRAGDLLIVRSNGNPVLVGKCAVWPGEPGFVYASYLIRFRFDMSAVNPHYVMYYLMSDHGRGLLAPKQGGGTYNISASEFRNVPIALPPREVQDKLVEELHEARRALGQIEKLKTRAQETIADSLSAVWER
jgi:restriction endonuclease S subunit